MFQLKMKYFNDDAQSRYGLEKKCYLPAGMIEF